MWYLRGGTRSGQPFLQSMLPCRPFSKNNRTLSNTQNSLTIYPWEHTRALTINSSIFACIIPCMSIITRIKFKCQSVPQPRPIPADETQELTARTHRSPRAKNHHERTRNKTTEFARLSPTLTGVSSNTLPTNPTHTFRQIKTKKGAIFSSTETRIR